jgi:hypothetical protein
MRAPTPAELRRSCALLVDVSRQNPLYCGQIVATESQTSGSALFSWLAA